MYDVKLLDMLPPPELGVDADVDAGADASMDVSALIVRPLTPDEVQTLAPVFAEHGVDLPDLRWATVLGAVSPDGTVTRSFIVIQLRVHAEPMNLEPGHEQLFSRLAHTAEEYIARQVGTCDVFLFAPPGKVTRLAELAGMQVEPWSVLTKRVHTAVEPVEPMEDSDGIRPN